MSDRASSDRFKPGDEMRMAERAGYRCEWYPARMRHGLIWKRCPFEHQDLRYFQMGHFIPVKARDGLGGGASDWKRNGILQCVPCNSEQHNHVPPPALIRRVVRDRKRHAREVRTSRMVAVGLVLSGVGLIVAMIAQAVTP